MSGVLRGAVVCESLKAGAVLEGYDLELTRLSRYEMAEPAPGQSPVWTLVEFEAPADCSDALAMRLSKDLASPGWYANWYTDDEAVVVFPEKVFRYKRGNRAARKRAQQYALDCGVPPAQLDWDD